MGWKLIMFLCYVIPATTILMNSEYLIGRFGDTRWILLIGGFLFSPIYIFWGAIFLRFIRYAIEVN